MTKLASILQCAPSLAGCSWVLRTGHRVMLPQCVSKWSHSSQPSAPHYCSHMQCLTCSQNNRIVWLHNREKAKDVLWVFSMLIGGPSCNPRTIWGPHRHGVVPQSGKPYNELVKGEKLFGPKIRLKISLIPKTDGATSMLFMKCCIWICLSKLHTTIFRLATFCFTCSEMKPRLCSFFKSPNWFLESCTTFFKQTNKKYERD